MTVPRSVLDALTAAVGAEHVLTDPEVVGGYIVDWTGRFRGSTPAVVRPGSHAEVAAVVRICDGARVAIVPQGGNTGLVGGSVPLAGEVVVNMRRLDALGPVDGTGAQVTAGAGSTLARVQAHVRAAGWDFGIDLGARDSATIGGMVATNAGGVQVLRHGPMRRQVVGLRAVLADGSVVDRRDGLEKDNTGYDLSGLLCGSEGTLAVITEARLRLVPRARHVVVALLAFATVADALVAVGELRRTCETLRALELFVADGLELVCAQLALTRPFATLHGAYVLAEAAAGSDPTDELAEVVAGLDRVADVAVATDSAGMASLWRYREGHTEAINRLGPPHKLDVTLPADQLAAFFPAVRAAVRAVAPNAQVWLFGHAGDGNVHVNVTGVEPDDDRISDAVLHLVARAHGSISAEHGIGTAKRQWVHLTRSETELRAFRAIKHALDPHATLNPNVLLP
jgi:FAD/FMN-containing dehydrogenase